VQVFGPTNGIDIKNTSVSFLGETFTARASEDMLGRVFNGQGRPKDGSGAIITAERKRT
jgi:V/A-type H+/Na+-transporting ATPase subunit B